jgi:hypothetical protein
MSIEFTAIISVDVNVNAGANPKLSVVVRNVAEIIKGYSDSG